MMIIERVISNFMGLDERLFNILSYDFTVKNVHLRIIFYQNFFKGFEVICFVG